MNENENNKAHSCEDYDGECQSWGGFHGNAQDLTYEDIVFRDSDIGFFGGYGS